MVSARTVADAVGFCVLKARLTTALGVREYIIRSTLPGKGLDVHKILALASIEYCNNWRMGSGGLNVNKIVDKAISELTDSGLLSIPGEKLRSEVRDDAIKMLQNLANILPQALEKLNINNDEYRNIKCYAENQLIDYLTHIIGTPDLIIEHPTHRKALIIEWKTAGITPNNTEKAQAYTYAILEALRLGYNNDIDTLLNAIAPNNIKDTKVFPIIIRPNGPYSDHPLFPYPPNRVNPRQVSDLRDYLKELIMASTFLVSLIADSAKLNGYRSYGDYLTDMKQNCYKSINVDNSQVSGIVIRFTPRTFRRGSPRNQSSRKICRACLFSDLKSPLAKSPLGMGECSFYFGQNSFHKNVLDKLMWKYRFIVYRERDSLLMPLKALYMASFSYGGLMKFSNIITQNEIIIDSFSTFTPSQRSRNAIKINFKDFNNQRIKVDIYDICFVNIEKIVLKRNMYPHERPSMNEARKLDIPREKGSILITLIEDHVSAVTLGTSLFARIEKMLIPGDYEFQKCGCNQDYICLLVVPISTYLRLPFYLFYRYVNYYGLRKVLVSEVNADLTNIDLNTINALHINLTSHLREVAAQTNQLDQFNAVENILAEAYNEAYHKIWEIR